MKESPAKLKKAYLYISRNDSALREKIEEIKRYIGSKAEGGTDLKVFDTDDRSSLEDFDGFVSASSLFSEQKVAVLEHIEKTPAGFQKKTAERLSGDSGADTIFIFTAPNEKINKALSDAVKKVGVIRNIRPVTSGDLLKWLEEKAASDGISIYR